MKRNLFALFGSVVVLLTATAATIAATAQASTQTSGAQQTPTNDPMVQQQDRAEEEEDFLNTLDQARTPSHIAVPRQTTAAESGGQLSLLSKSGRAMSLIIMPSTGVIPAMPVEGIIDPACVRTIRRSPKRSPPDSADNAADHSTGRPSDHKPGPSAECCPNGIGFRTDRSSKRQEKRYGRQ